MVDDNPDNGVQTRWTLDTSERVPFGKNTLLALTFNYRYSDLGDFAGEYFDVRNIFILVDGGRKVIDVDTQERAIELAGELSAAPGHGGKPIHEWLEVRPFLQHHSETIE